MSLADFTCDRCGTPCDNLITDRTTGETLCEQCIFEESEPPEEDELDDDDIYESEPDTPDHIDSEDDIQWI